MNKYRIENPNNNKVREYKSRTTEEAKGLTNSLKYMTVLEKSSQGYSLNKNNDKNQTNLNQNDEGFYLIAFSYNDIAGFLHELRHGKQFEDGEIGFDMKTGQGVGIDIYDEVEAFNFQGDCAPGSIVDEMRDDNGNITPETIRSVDKKYKTNYNDLPNQKVNMKSIAKDNKMKRNYYFKEEN